MYKIVGTDQKEYGPITADQIRQWVTEGRANAQTKVQAADSPDWVCLGEVPEFADALRHAAPPLPAKPATTPAKTSGLAIASLTLGILGLFTCGLTALVGLVLGIISMGKIKKSGGQLGGSGIALSGTVVSAVFIVLIPVFIIMAAMLLPALSKAKQRAQTIACVNNLKQLALATRIYSTDHQDQFPPAETWCDAILPEVASEKVFKCPAADNNQKCHYAFNAKLDGLNTSKVDPQTVLFFETSGGWNLSGGPELMLDSSRHGNLFVVAFADGSVQQIKAAQLQTLRWEP